MRCTIDWRNGMFNEPAKRPGVYLGSWEKGPVVLLDGETKPTLVPQWTTIEFPAQSSDVVEGEKK